MRPGSGRRPVVDLRSAGYTTDRVDGGALAEAALPVVREAIGRGILYQAL